MNKSKFIMYFVSLILTLFHWNCRSEDLVMVQSELCTEISVDSLQTKPGAQISKNLIKNCKSLLRKKFVEFYKERDGAKCKLNRETESGFHLKVWNIKNYVDETDNLFELIELDIRIKKNGTLLKICKTLEVKKASGILRCPPPGSKDWHDYDKDLSETIDDLDQNIKQWLNNERNTFKARGE